MSPLPTGTKTPMNPAISDKPTVAELKNGKIIFRQKPIFLENHSETMQEIVTFRGLIKRTDTPLGVIPDEYLPLIAKLVHESDKTLNTLIKSLQSSLIPPVLDAFEESDNGDASSCLPASTVEHAIKAVAERINYGIAMNIDKPPAALCVWRWEIKNMDWLPKSVAEKAAARFEERLAAKEHLQSVFDELSSDKKEAILKTIKPNKSARGKDTVIETGGGRQQASQSPTPEQTGESSEPSTMKPGRPKKQTDPETIAKEKEKQEKKTVKAEKEKKAAEATKRSAAVFANFFKPAGQSSKSSKGDDSGSVRASALHSSPTSAHLNEFEATFRPFVLKKDSQLAPINWFALKKRKQNLQICFEGKEKQHEIIELDTCDEHDVQGDGDRCTPLCVELQEDDVSNSTPKELLHSFLDSTRSLYRRRRTELSLNSKPTYRVRDLVNRLTEAEVQGDQRNVRRLAALLKNRQKIPAKVLFFIENNRPGYLGTWTRTSLVIHPRGPFARDLVSFDYDYDSDAEWEDGEDGEDVNSQDESVEDEDDTCNIESDLDDWLVDGDGIEVDSTNSQLPGCDAHKRKAAQTREVPNKKRKVLPLIPFQKGPIWEKEIGECDYEPFQSMHIQLLNDTPSPVDPFTFISAPMLSDKAESSTTKSEGVFVVPALPGHLCLRPGEFSTESRHIANPKTMNSQSLPKTIFPDAHVSLLLQKITESSTNSFVVLLDSVFQDLKSLGVKKNALEVKLREVAEKDKARRSWVVNEDAWARHGLVKPA